MYVFGLVILCLWFRGAHMYSLFEIKFLFSFIVTICMIRLDSDLF